MLLAIDAGNTSTALGLWDADELVADWRVATRAGRTADEIAIELRQLFALRDLGLYEVTAACIATVVPNLQQPLVEACERYLRLDPVVVGPGVKTGVHIRYENPKEVGADRIANALAVHRLYGAPAVVIDFGTAVTYDAVDGEGAYLGGAIAPGIDISLEALVAHTARLSRVEPTAPPHVIGRTTATAIQSGLVWGFVGQVEGMVRRMADELGGGVRVVATGGQAEAIAGLTDCIDLVDHLLTLQGVRLIYEQNRT
jgi:type III pantothenate kinase